MSETDDHIVDRWSQGFHLRKRGDALIVYRTSNPRGSEIACRALGAICLLMASALTASTLQTPRFDISIETLCAEGDVSCNDVRYVGISKRSGASITLRGTTLHRACKDGSPCQFLGYQFRSGSVRYRVFEDGRLEVTDGTKVLVDERGEWQW
ncbi:MAG: hypothetical protein BWZ07_01527 [Alphaproteobacteria bacterium ADurb.BinA280]|nr:MAG: hypothetical protein BWZ07_01527 [Alphaproteobacteria bacterium ADurb.BinA280]